MAGIESPHNLTKSFILEERGPKELPGIPAQAGEVAGWTSSLNAMTAGKGATMPEAFDKAGNNFTLMEAAGETIATAARGSVPSTIGDRTAPAYDFRGHEAAILAAWPNSPPGSYGKNEFRQSISNERDPGHSHHYDSAGHRHDTRQG
jgi:hypothetical protein